MKNWRIDCSSGGTFVWFPVRMRTFDGSVVNSGCSRQCDELEQIIFSSVWFSLFAISQCRPVHPMVHKHWYDPSKSRQPAPFLHTASPVHLGISAHSFTFSWQVAPVQPSGHWHVKEIPRSRHSPPFAQESFRQAVRGNSQRGPMNFGGQMHRYPPDQLTHLPPGGRENRCN